jgi:hypothetical protein
MIVDPVLEDYHSAPAVPARVARAIDSSAFSPKMMERISYSRIRDAAQRLTCDGAVSYPPA